MDKATHPAVREAVSALTSWVGWLGASVVGLTAVCYAAGYFAIHTHLTMLGLSGVVDVSTDQLLLEGGLFFYYTLAQLLAAGMVIVLIPTGLWLIIKAIYQVPRIKRNRAIAHVRDGLTNDRAKAIFSYLLPIAVIVVVVVHYDSYYNRLSSLQWFNNLAFSSTKGDPGTFGGQVSPMIASGNEADRGYLVATYRTLIFNYAGFISAIWIVVYKIGETPLGRIAKAFFIIYTILLTAFLPMAYGVLVRTPIYPVANLALKDGQQAHGLLLQRTEHNLLVWNPATRHAVSYDNSDISSVEVVGERDIFQKD